MNPGNQLEKSQFISLRIDPELCNGCVVCLKACPAKAMRVRGGVAHIVPELCVDCGICYQVCTQGAIEVCTGQLDGINRYRYPVAVPASALFSQFGFNTSPNQLLLALKQIGFKEVVDTSWLCEMVGVAMEEYLLAHPKLKPGISPICPAVVKLITKRFPSLVPNLIPVLPPPDPGLQGGSSSCLISATAGTRPRWAYSSSAPARPIWTCCTNPLAWPPPTWTRSLCIGEVYGPVLKALRHLKEGEKIQKSSGVGLSWAALGGQAAQVKVENTMYAAGFKDVVTILEMLEAGRLGGHAFFGGPHLLGRLLERPFDRGEPL